VPEVTILLPIRKFHGQYLAEAVDSVLGQTEENWQLLAIVEPVDEARFTQRIGPALDDARVTLVAN
jgi:hypothetical protein